MLKKTFFLFIICAANHAHGELAPPSVYIKDKMCGYVSGSDEYLTYVPEEVGWTEISRYHFFTIEKCKNILPKISTTEQTEGYYNEKCIELSNNDNKISGHIYAKPLCEAAGLTWVGQIKQKATPGPKPLPKKSEKFQCAFRRDNDANIYHYLIILIIIYFRNRFK